MKEHSRTQYSLYNIGASFVGYGLNLVLSFVCRMIFVRYLSEEYLGISGLFTNIISMLSLTELGIGSAIIYALYKPLADKDEDKMASLMKFYGTAYKTIGIIIGLIGVACLPFLNIIIKEPPNISENIYVIYLLYLFSTASSYFFSYKSSIITASQRNYIVVGISYVVVIVQNIIQIFILIKTRNYISYLLIQIACTFITNILISYKAKKDYPFISNRDAIALTKDEKIALFKNVKALTMTKLSGILVNNTDNIVITYFNGLVTTGAASNYILLSSILHSLLNQIFGGLTASIGNLNATENDERKFFFFKVINLANFWLYGWATVGIALVSSDLVELCFGSNYVLNANIPLILAINFYMVGMQSAVWTYKSTLGLFKHGQYLLLVTAFINIVGDIYFGKKFGLFGIFFATAISRLLTNTWYDPYAVYKYGLNISPLKYLRTYLHYLSVLVLSGVPCYVLCKFLNVNLFFKVIFKMIICTLVPNFVFFLFFYKTSEFKYVYDKICRMIFKKMK